MREILFRGKRIDNGEWVYGYYFCMHHDDDREHIHHFIIPLNVPIPKDKPIGEIQVEVNPETVGQYTGVTTHKNGKKIFDGDIVKNYFSKRFRPSVGRVAFDERNCSLKLYSCTGGSESGFYRGCVYEVIGNIHDNPELLEDEP